MHVARTSHTQVRLLSQLDAMDALRATHERELVAEIRANERLSSKLRRYYDYIKEARVQWDDMRETVALVLEKGGSGLLREVEGYCSPFTFTRYSYQCPTILCS